MKRSLSTPKRSSHPDPWAKRLRSTPTLDYKETLMPRGSPGSPSNSPTRSTMPGIKTCHACPRKDSRISKLVQDNDGLLMANEYLRSKINTLEQKEDYHVETLEKLRVNHEVLDNQVKSLIDAKGNFPDAKIPELENQSLRTKASVIERRGATDIATLADMEKQITSLEVASERKDVDHMAAEEKIRHLELHKHELEVQIHQMKDYTRTSGSNVSLGSEDKAMYEAQIKSLNEKLESFRHEAKMRLEYVEMGQRLMRDLFSRD